MSDILLGYEVGTGKEVRVPFAHTVVCGQTQVSGKTTTLEGMLSRTGDPLRPALAFLTKRAESSFVAAHRIPPYFRDRWNKLLRMWRSRFMVMARGTRRQQQDTPLACICNSPNISSC